jgi:valyl-tRNA synthetase
MIAVWPGPRPDLEDEEAEEGMAALQELISTVRTIRSEYNVPVSTEAPVVLSHETPSFRALVSEHGELLSTLANARVREGAAEDGAGMGAHAVLRSGAELVVPLEGLIDVRRESERLRGELERVGGLLEVTEKRLANEDFVTKAPAEVVEREREKGDSLRDQRERLARKLKALT